MLQRNLEAKVESKKFCNHYDNTLAQIFHLSHVTGPLLKIRCVRKVIDMKNLSTNTMLFTRKPGVLHATPDCLKIHAQEIYKIHLQ